MRRSPFAGPSRSLVTFVRRATPRAALMGSMLLGSVLLLGGCSGGGGAAAPLVLTTLAVTLNPTAIQVGQVSIATAAGADQKGGTIATGSIIWASSTPSVATVSSAGNILAVGAGTTTISATSGSTVGRAVLTVTLAPVATVNITPTTVTLAPAGTQQLSASTLDAGGSTLSGRTVTWTTGDAAIATVSTTGLVTGVSAGSVTVTATSEGKSGTTTVNVALPPTLTSVSPSTLTPGSAVTVSGSRFSSTIAENVVRIGGAVATVTSASTTQLTATVPCVPSGSASVSVVVNGLTSGTTSATVTGRVRTLAAGQAVILTSSSTSACNELPVTSGSTTYLVTVHSAAVGQNTLTDFELRGNVGSALTQADASVPNIRSPIARFSVAPSATTDADREHLSRLEAGRALYAQLRGAARTSRQSSLRQSSARLSSAVALPAVGDRRSFFYNYVCSDTTKRLATKAIYVGTRAIIWEDTTNTRQSSADGGLASYYARIGQLFDQEQYDVVRTNFSDPLLRDAVTDNDGRVNMIFTQRINTDNPSAAAFVQYCDQFPPTLGSSVRASNFGEFFYSSVPTLAGSGPNDTRYADGWFSFIGRTVVHEVKHIASAAARVANDAPSFEESWLEEGLARQAEELWTRQYIHRVPWKGNSGYGTASTNGVYCDFNPTSTVCLIGDPTHRPSYGVRRQFNELLPKLVDPWNWSIYGDGTGQSGSVFYQTVWSLARYAIDRYGVSDAAYLSAVTNAQTTGTTSLAAVAGVSVDVLLGGWSLALYADDYPGLASPSADITIPTWNFRDIYAGLNADPGWSSRFTTSFPLIPTPLSYGGFVVTQLGLRGGAASYYLLSGSSASPQLLDLRAVGGGSPSSSLRVSIARLR